MTNQVVLHGEDEGGLLFTFHQFPHFGLVPPYSAQAFSNKIHPSFWIWICCLGPFLHACRSSRRVSAWCRRSSWREWCHAARASVKQEKYVHLRPLARASKAEVEVGLKLSVRGHMRRSGASGSLRAYPVVLYRSAQQ